MTLWTPAAQAYPSYDDGSGIGCVQCHNGFQGGSGPLHLQHRTEFGVTSCNACHPSGGGSTPVLTYSSGAGGGLGCAGCHGQDYGETSPNSGQPKATAYGLRLVHAARGVTVCSECHFPGSDETGQPDPEPEILPEHVPPPYYNPIFSNLADPCSSAQEDLPFDADSVGLDNDGDGFADFPADTDCPEAVPTPSPTPIPPFNCGSQPAGGCIAAGKGVLLVNEKSAGKEKLKVLLKALQAAVTPEELGDPVTGTTAYKACIYDGADQLSGEYTVARAEDTCGDAACWSAVSDKGYKYSDDSAESDGIVKINLSGGDLGKGKVMVVGTNSASTMRTGVAAALQGQTSATVQVLTSDAACFGASLSRVKKADGALFKALGP